MSGLSVTSGNRGLGHSICLCTQLSSDRPNSQVCYFFKVVDMGFCEFFVCAERQVFNGDVSDFGSFECLYLVSEFCDGSADLAVEAATDG